MKNRNLKLSILLFLISFFFTACSPFGKVSYYIGEKEYYVSLKSDGTLRLPNDPEKYGYRFMGWYLDETTWEEKITDETVVSADRIIYPYFKQEYRIKFLLNDDIYHDILVVAGETIELPEPPQIEDFEFNGWFFDRQWRYEFNPEEIDKAYTRGFLVFAYMKEVYSRAVIHHMLSQSIFKVKMLNDQDSIISQGSGFFIKDDGTFVTCAHIVKNAHFGLIDEEGNPDDKNISSIFVYDDAADFSVLKVENPENELEFTPVVLSDDYQVGDTIYSIGYPFNNYTSVISRGVILGESPFYIVTDAYIDRGSSGGVTVNDHGEVIGISGAIFSNGTYGTISSKKFMTYATEDLGKGDTILWYFHPKQPLDLNFEFKNTFDYIPKPQEQVIMTYWC